MTKFFEGTPFRAHLLTRTLQFILSLTILGLYAHNLSPTTASSNSTNTEGYKDLISLLDTSHPSPSPTNPLLAHLQIFTISVAALSAFSAAVLSLVLFRKNLPWVWIWDAVLTLLWFVVFAYWGKLYVGGDGEKDGGTVEKGVVVMRNAVWLDLTTTLLWGISAVGMCLYGRATRGKALFKKGPKGAGRV